MTRIPADKSALFDAWAVPEVKEGQIVQAEKLKKRGPRGELIDVDKNEVIYNKITAAQLEEISNQAYEDVRVQAHKEGFKQGHDEGYQAGLKAAQQTIKQQTGALNTAVAQIYQFLGGQDDEVEQALVNVAICIASAVLRRELTIDASHLQQVIREAIELLPMAASHIQVHLSEADYELLSEHSEIPDVWQLQIDRKLTPGGCRVTSQHSIVDYTLEEQFQQTVNQLVEKRFETLSAQARGRAQSDRKRPPHDKDSSEGN